MIVSIRPPLRVRSLLVAVTVAAATPVPAAAAGWRPQPVPRLDESPRPEPSAAKTAQAPSGPAEEGRSTPPSSVESSGGAASPAPEGVPPDLAQPPPASEVPTSEAPAAPDGSPGNPGDASSFQTTEPQTVPPGWGPAADPASAQPRPAIAPTDSERRQRRERRTALGLLIGGFAGFGTAYLASAIYGAGEIDRSGFYDDFDDDEELYDERRLSYGRRMLIPVVGPYIATPLAASASDGLFTVLAGTAQIAGLAIGVTGSVLFAKVQRRTGLRVGISATPQAAWIRIGGRF